MKSLTQANAMMRVCSLGSRLLVATTFAIIVLMPLTEYFWHFDQFLQGGQDFELSLIAILTVFCLILVLLQHGKKDLEVMVRLRRRLAGVLGHARQSIPGAFRGLISSLHAEPFPSATLAMRAIPLQI